MLDLPFVLGGSGVGYRMGDLYRVARLGDSIGCDDDSNPDETDGVPTGALGRVEWSVGIDCWVGMYFCWPWGLQSPA